MVIFSHQPDHIRSSNSCPVFFTSESRADGVTPRFQAALGRLQWSEISNVFLWIFTMDCQFLHLRHQLCTLWLCQNSYWIACHRNSWFTHTTWWFSIVMWKFTRGYSPCILHVSPIFMAKKTIHGLRSNRRGIRCELRIRESCARDSVSNFYLSWYRPKLYLLVLNLRRVAGWVAGGCWDDYETN